jgi:hypothetical protein
MIVRIDEKTFAIVSARDDAEEFGGRPPRSLDPIKLAAVRETLARAIEVIDREGNPRCPAT